MDGRASLRHYAKGDTLLGDPLARECQGYRGMAGEFARTRTQAVGESTKCCPTLAANATKPRISPKSSCSGAFGVATVRHFRQFSRARVTSRSVAGHRGRDAGDAVRVDAPRARPEEESKLPPEFVGSSVGL